MRWDAQQGYAGLTAAYLANLDDALATLHRHGIVVDLVVYGAAKGSRARYQFHTEALDGHHAAMRAGYLQALRDLVRHLARSPTAAATVAVLDLFNEAYLQLERFGLSDEVIYRWLQEEYDAAHGAAPGFNYTVSDTTRLLKDDRSWGTMYPADVYDIHVYDDKPWAHAALYARGKALGKPWFSGEAGCAPGHASCTYDGNATCVQPQTCALSVDRWFLEHLRADGARRAHRGAQHGSLLSERTREPHADARGPARAAHGLTSTRGEGAALGGHAGRTVDASHGPLSLRGTAAPDASDLRACLIHASAAAFSAARSAPAMMWGAPGIHSSRVVTPARRSAR
jgi:hypothetical protein